MRVRACARTRTDAVCGVKFNLASTLATRVPRRTVGARAAARYGLGLAELMRAGLLVAGDALSFAYGGRVHTAALTADARIACAAGDSNTTTYSAPTHWALACVDAYWRAAHAGTRPTTNPSGYTRVRSVRHGCTLNALRDRLLAAAPPPPPPPPPSPPSTPRNAAKRRRGAAARQVPPAMSVVTLARPESLGEACARRSGGNDGGGGTPNRKRGYKALAMAMQADAARLARTVLAHEAALRALAAPPDGGVTAEALESAYAYARHIYAMTQQQQ